jgi:hypothetical protein
MQPRLCLCWLHVDYKFVLVETNWHVLCELYNYDIISVCHVDCSRDPRVHPMENNGVGKKISAISMTWSCLNLSSYNLASVLKIQRFGYSIG